jgi:proline dehydrogenase
MGQLAEEGCTGTLDILGEKVASEAAAQRTREAYQEALQAVAERRLRSGISVKLTALGRGLDDDLCRRNLSQILATAAELGRFVRVDMEESSQVPATLDLVLEAHRQGRRIGAVLQARLHRSPQDAARLAAEGVPIRLVKGIYLEPASIAHTSFGDIQAAFLRLLEQLVASRSHIAIATHDHVLLRRAIELVRQAGLSPSRYEFQMLLGVRPELRRQLVEAGHPVRVYVPFGPDWFPYSVRRLQENPRMARDIAQTLFFPDRHPQLNVPPA